MPHADVLEGTFQQSEFAADITAVHTGKATWEYQDAAAFFERTFITEGMRLLLTSDARRLNSQGGAHVIQLQTAFGGGKTHTMLAVYHLATRKCALKDLPGIPALLDQAKLMDMPKARVVVLDGTALSPGQPWKHGKQAIHTLLGRTHVATRRRRCLRAAKRSRRQWHITWQRGVADTLGKSCVLRRARGRVGRLHPPIFQRPSSKWRHLRQQSVLRPSAHGSDETRSERRPARLTA